MDSGDDDQNRLRPLVHDPEAAAMQFSDVVDFGAMPDWANYAAVNGETLRLRIESLIAQVSTVLSIPRRESTVLLLCFRWQLKDLIEAWRSDDSGIGEKLKSLMETEPEFERDDDLLIRSFVEHNPNIRWCPNPGCCNAVEALNGVVSDISCACSNRFCWNCSGEAHRPVDCTTRKKWSSEISPETQTMNQILVFFKHCPKCRQPIEFELDDNNESVANNNESDVESVANNNESDVESVANNNESDVESVTSSGRFVICPSPCNHNFCLSCLQSWDLHDVNGDCLSSINNENVEQSAAKVTAGLRYFRFLSRWEAYEASEERAVEAFKKVKTEGDKIDFLVMAWEQIRNCRKILKWRYVSLYFLQGDDKLNKKKDRVWFIEADKALRNLHNRVKKFNSKMLKNSDRCDDEFVKFRRTVIEMTVRAKCCFENLVYAVQNQNGVIRLMEEDT